MAGAHMAPCSLSWETTKVGAGTRRCRRKRSESGGPACAADGASVPGAGVSWSDCSPSTIPALKNCNGGVWLHMKSGRRRWTGICSAWSNFRGRGEPARGADASTLIEMAALADDLLKLNGVVNEDNRGIGPDMRHRVDTLYNRATLLKQSADRTVAAGGRVPAQLIATLKALQREHTSVENIVRLAMEAGPVRTDTEEPVSERSLSLKELKKPTLRLGGNADQKKTLSIVLKEKESKAPLFASLILESSIAPVEPASTTGTPKYVMSSAAAKDSSPLAAFRREIERRVMEQLVRTNSDPNSNASTEAAEERDPVATVLRDDGPKTIFESLPSEERVARERYERGAANDEVQQAKPRSGSLDVTEAQAQTLQAAVTSSSLAETQRRLRSAAAETRSKLKELDKLRSDLSVLGKQLANSKQDAARADMAEAQVRQLEGEMATKVPLDVHEQAVRLGRESLLEARAKITQVTAELREKESMLEAVKQELMAEQGKLLEKVRELSGEVAQRVSAEEMEAAVNRAVREVQIELESALERAESLSLELETKEKLFAQQRAEWEMEKANLSAELLSMKTKLADMERERIGEKAELSEALEKVSILEDSLCELQEAMFEAEKEREKREEYALATARSLIADMVRMRRAKARSNTIDLSLLEAMEKLQGGDDGSQVTNSVTRETNVEDVLGALFSGQKAVALEAFFVTMAVLIKQESEKLALTDYGSESTSADRQGAAGVGTAEPENDHSEQDLSIVRSSEGAMETRATPVITLYYESSWEFVYLHYSADNSEWTTLPGVCMHNCVVVNNKPLKVINVPGTSLEFVLTDGKGSWDCAPSGGNYRIQNSGTFLLSSGFIEQRR